MNYDNLNPAVVNKLYKKGQDALKINYFTFKFSPDYLSAVHYFTDSAKAYKKLKMFKESIKAFEDAIKCNKELLESWAEALNFQEIADIYMFELNDFNSGWKYLKNSSMSYKYSGKFTSGIKVYMDFSQKLIENSGKYSQAVTILKEALEDCYDQTHDELIRISMEEAFNKLLDVLCYLESYVDAINLLEKYIKIQKSIKEEKKHKISKNYLKLGMLRIIIDELYMAENLQDEMMSCYDSSSADDIDDLRKLIKAFKESNKKDFNYLVTYGFSLFQNNLLKGLKKAFDQKCEQNMNNGIVGNVINIQHNADLATSNYDFDETKAYSEFSKDTNIEDISVSQNVVNNNAADEYL